jgi:hypothetical protein
MVMRMAKTPSLKASTLFLFMEMDLRNGCYKFFKPAQASGSEKEKQ